MTSLKNWEKKILASPGAPQRVAQIEEELRLAAGLTSLREQAGLSQRELASRIGVRQPRIAAIERSRNVTVDVLERYVAGLGGHIELSVVRAGKRTSLIGGGRGPLEARPRVAKTPARNKAANQTRVATATSAKKATAKTAQPSRTRATKTTSRKAAARTNSK